MSHSDAQAFLSELDLVKNDLPFDPGLLQTLFAQTEDGSNASLEEVARTISLDQGLTARVLSLANSAFYGLQSEVDTVRRAATVLGLAEIRNLVAVLGVRGLVDRHVLPEGFDMDRYWRHQIRVAVAARLLGKMAGSDRADSLFTAGLLHDLGKLVTALYRPEKWRAIQDLAQEQELEDVEAEDRFWGLDHAVIGGLLLKSWDFPPGLTEPVNWHHAPHLAAEVPEEAAVLALADAAMHLSPEECDSDGSDTGENASEGSGPEQDDAEERSAWARRVDRLIEELELDPENVREAMAEVREDESVDQFIGLLT